ncbi:DE-cadherin-like isoform X2 [Amphibalanus amphitrite]|uniref:DE-cadherin-like isoform X1 n=1 Tax=Amphibalanus amphitrite TaxID=1232801 RepID=UPI001C8FF8B9|nr:DE-cadherin-like isoform X1 [Amphibalanus amphitrite]XP_043205388.1 DE-cadherin-like isoform X2 [Amphibalanus amphitrite]
MSVKVIFSMSFQRCFTMSLLAVLLALTAISDAGAHRKRRQSIVPTQYVLNNVTAGTKINTRLLTLPSRPGAKVQYTISDPTRFRVDDDGGVYTRVAGSELVRAAGAFNFTVRAEDTASGSAQLATVLLSAGNQPPQFSDDLYRASVLENAAGGSLVVAVVAQDPNTDAIRYSIRTSGLVDTTLQYEMFTINELTGVIRLRSGEIRFDEEEYRFTVVARDPSDLEDTASVTVRIIDVNDNRPVFNDCDQYQPEVAESQPAGTFVLKVVAEDADKGLNAELVYALVTSPNAPESLFEIDSANGRLTTSKKFNRDAPDHEKSLRVIVKASDKGTPSLEGTCVFMVTVLDINDNPPMFDKQAYENSVAKDVKVDTQVERVSATDDDIGPNAAITYSLEAKYPPNARDFFQIDPHTGIISSKTSLAALGTNTEVLLTAVATDQGKPALSARAQVTIAVKDSSLQPPTFTEPPQPRYMLKENYRDTETPIATLRAVSNLEGSPKVYYELLHGAQEQTNKFRTFVVDENEDGEAIVRYGGTRQLDYEQTPAYNITVVATTDQQTSAQVTFQIVLEDRNDNVPTFYDADQAVVPENSVPGTFVAVVSAVDGDATRPNNQVTYSLDRESAEYQLFSIESGTGRISTRVPLDREDASRPSPFYTVTVYAEDGAPSDISPDGQPNKDKQRITVEIGDVNDNPPKFETAIDTAHVKENVDIGSKVFDIKATDIDSDSKINYQITGGNLGAAFDIDQVTGTVTVKNNLDYETTKRYNITVTASDGVYEDSHQVTIEVENENDVPPTFDQPSYEKSMQEGYLPATPILTVTATDPDPIGTPSIIYKLSGPGIYEDHPERNVFSINSEGEVIVIKPLDRDKGTGGREVWDISIQAWDDGGNGLFSTAQFKLMLSDINDNAPYLIQSADSTPVIMENRKIDGISISVEADDFDDTEMNGAPFSFELDPAASDDIRSKFSVTTGDDGTALIRPKMEFDREATKQYKIPILVSDSPSAYPNPLTGTSLFTVIIGDENDNDMKPGSSVISVFNLEGKMPDTVIGRVYVDDPDDWDLPDKTFTFVDGDQRRFGLDSNTGDIIMRHGTSNGTYLLKFSVYDDHWKSTVDADVTVVVRLLPREAVVQSGSIRIAHLSAEQFVTAQSQNTPSRYTALVSELARTFAIPEENVDLFGVQDNGAGGVDVRYAAHGSPYYASQKMDGLVSENVRQFEESLKIEIQQVNIDECVNETTCDGNSCLSSLKIFDNEVYKIQTNLTSIIGVKTMMTYDCGKCQSPPPADPCMNGGHLVTDPVPRCQCPDGFGGPNCEGLTIHFKGEGYAWFPRLGTCTDSQLSFDLTTNSDQGLVMYNGPLGPPTGGIQDFFAVDVFKGRLRAFLNYGSGTFVASPQTPVDDGRRHHVDVIWSAQEVTVLLDSCLGRPECQSSAEAPPAPGALARLLNVDTPLQLGGSAVPLSVVRQAMAWLLVPESEGFYGCLENVTFLGTAYDLSNPTWGEEYTSTCEELIVPIPVIYADSSFLAAILTCLFLAVLLLAVAIFIRQRNVKKYKSLKDQLGMDTIGHDGIDSTEPSTLRVEDRFRAEEVPPLAASAAFVSASNEAIDDDNLDAARDDLRNYAYEGASSTAGSLSTINSGTTDADMEFDYLLEMGPHFRRLADIYGVSERFGRASSDSEDGEPSAATLDTEPGESWC